MDSLNSSLAQVVPKPQLCKAIDMHKSQHQGTHLCCSMAEAAALTERASPRRAWHVHAHHHKRLCQRVQYSTC